MPTLQEERVALIEDLKKTLPVADRKARFYFRMHLALAIATGVGSLLAAFLTGDSALGGTVIAKPVAKAITGNQPSDLALGWRYICGIAAGCALVAGISSIVNNVSKANEHCTKATACSGKIAAIKLRLDTELKPNRATIDKSREDYAALLEEYRPYLY